MLDVAYSVKRRAPASVVNGTCILQAKNVASRHLTAGSSLICGVGKESQLSRNVGPAAGNADRGWPICRRYAEYLGEEAFYFLIVALQYDRAWQCGEI